MEPILDKSFTDRVELVFDYVVAGAIIVAVFLALAAAYSLAVMWLWNVILPDLFGWPTITFWQALGLTVLCHLLFNPPRPSNNKG
jgi:hypothetical protein